MKGFIKLTGKCQPFYVSREHLSLYYPCEQGCVIIVGKETLIVTETPDEIMALLEGTDPDVSLSLDMLDMLRQTVANIFEASERDEKPDPRDMEAFREARRILGMEVDADSKRPGYCDHCGLIPAPGVCMSTAANCRVNR